MNFNMLYKKRVFSALIVLFMVLVFSLKYGAIYTSLGLALLISTFFVFFKEDFLEKRWFESIGVIISGGLGAIFF